MLGRVDKVDSATYIANIANKTDEEVTAYYESQFNQQDGFARLWAFIEPNLYQLQIAKNLSLKKRYELIQLLLNFQEKYIADTYSSQLDLYKEKIEKYQYVCDIQALSEKYDAIRENWPKDPKILLIYMQRALEMSVPENFQNNMQAQYVYIAQYFPLQFWHFHEQLKKAFDQPDTDETQCDPFAFIDGSSDFTGQYESIYSNYSNMPDILYKYMLDESKGEITTDNVTSTGILVRQYEYLKSKDPSLTLLKNYTNCVSLALLEKYKFLVQPQTVVGCLLDVLEQQYGCFPVETPATDLLNCMLISAQTMYLKHNNRDITLQKIIECQRAYLQTKNVAAEVRILHDVKIVTNNHFRQNCLVPLADEQLMELVRDISPKSDEAFEYLFSRMLKMRENWFKSLIFSANNLMSTINFFAALKTQYGDFIAGCNNDSDRIKLYNIAILSQFSCIFDKYLGEENSSGYYSGYYSQKGRGYDATYEPDRTKRNRRREVLNEIGADQDFCGFLATLALSVTKKDYINQAYKTDKLKILGSSDNATIKKDKLFFEELRKVGDHTFNTYMANGLIERGLADIGSDEETMAQFMITNLGTGSTLEKIVAETSQKVSGERQDEIPALDALHLNQTLLVKKSSGSVFSNWSFAGIMSSTSSRRTSMEDGVGLADMNTKQSTINPTQSNK